MSGFGLIRDHFGLEGLISGNFGLESLIRGHFSLHCLIIAQFGSGPKPGLQSAESGSQRVSQEIFASHA